MSESTQHTKMPPKKYQCPAVSKGDWLPDLRFGIVQVEGITDTPIPWPYTILSTGHTLILTHPIQKALQQESLASISYLWGIDGKKAQHYKDLAHSKQKKAWDNYETLAMLKMHVAGRDSRYIANALGWAASAVEAHLKNALDGPRKPYTPRKKNKPYSIDWDKYQNLLGVVPDSVLARLIGVYSATVAYHRLQSNTPPKKLMNRGGRKRNRINWADWDRLLGTVTDTELAGKIGCSLSSVSTRRKAFGIAPYRNHYINWADWETLLNTMSDNEAAEIIGCSPASVGRRRHLSKKSKRNRINWADWDRLLGTMADAELAEKIGCSLSSVQKRRSEKKIKPYNKTSTAAPINWADWDHLIDTMPDKELAEKIGCHARSVAYRRRGNKNLLISPINWAEWGHLLGTMMDKELAEKIGCSISSVQQRRKKLGIKRYK